MAMHDDTFERLAVHGVVPVVEIDRVDDAVPLARVLADAGLGVLELTLRTSAALEAIRRVATTCPQVVVGAGTILGPDMVVEARRAGALFGVSPGLSRRILTAAAAHELPIVPGVATPTEILTALEQGARHLKFFPARGYGGVSTLAALAGPFASAAVRFMPTAGVNDVNAPEYLRLKNVFAVGGSWIAPRDDVRAGRWAAIGARARAAVEMVRSRARGPEE